MSAALVAVIAVVAVVALLGVALLVQRHRLAKRFARKLSPYTRQRMPGGEALDPEEWNRR
jgi:hypothetical protein